MTKFVATATLALVCSLTWGSEKPDAMMHAYWMRLAREAFDRHDAAYEQIKTPAQLTAHQRRMREFFRTELGGFPERTPLNPQVVGRMERNGYRIEKIIFESQPKHYVTALLYLPNAKPPYPGVLVPCGHSAEGKAYDSYQRVCILLAKNGLAAFCYDPIDQGERIQLLDEAGKPRMQGTDAHSQIGVGSILLGRNTATFRVWDGMRALDYLQSRPEIDPKRIGCTGNSGGGTLTSYLMALDDRIQCAAPGCYITSLRRLMETIGPQDAEQNIHAQIAQGMDHADYILMHAPQPTLICAAKEDFFDIGGTRDTFRKARRGFALMGVPERVDMVEADGKHGFSLPLRVGAVRWMRRWLLGNDEPVTEADTPVLTKTEALCTPRGQVMLLPGARNVYDLNSDLETELAETRRQFWRQTPRNRALEEVRQITGIRKLDALPKPQCERAGSVARQGYRVEELILRPEPDIWLPALLFVPDRPGGERTLYLNVAGKDADAAIEKLAAEGRIVLAVDLRGLGETQPAGKEGRLGREWKDVFQAYMLGTSYLAKRTEDILVCARFLASYEAARKPQKVHVVSIGLTGPPALHAVALERQLFASLTLRDGVGSWSEVVRTPLASNQLINIIPGALRCYDLPDLLATLPKTSVTR